MRSTIKLLCVTVLVCLVSVPAWAQCVPYTQEIKGPFIVGMGWGVEDVVTTLNGHEIELSPVAPGVPPNRGWASIVPSDHGWSTHWFEMFAAAIKGNSGNTFGLITHWVAPVESTDPPAKGDRRDVEYPIRFDFNYLGEGNLTNGTGAFEGAKGHIVTRGTFWLNFAGEFSPFEGSYTFVTKGQFCGVDLEALGLQ